MSVNFDAIESCMARDTGRLIALKRKIQSAKGAAREHAITQWHRLVEKSADQVKLRQDSVPDISLPSLPVSDQAERIIELIKQNQILVLAGETGSGKTTQLPKLCLQAGLGVRGFIGHTQPRRVAATSVASRIAEELNSELGQTVGVSVRFFEKLTDRSLVKVMTDGILLAEIQRDPFLSKYEVIIIDEAHERSINIDFLLGYLKQLTQKRSDLKVIITSATIDVERFSEHFRDAPVISVEGRTFPVDIKYLPAEPERVPSGESPELYQIQFAVKDAIREGQGDILIFLPGEGEIRQVANQLRKLNLSQTTILPLYARLSIKEQQKVFKPVVGRKIVLATNVAETSLTVPGIRFVIDPGTARISRFSMRSKIQRLPIERISQASANQRAGRCGRVSAGICYRLFSEEDFIGRQEFTLPEIKRTNLASVILQMKLMGIKELETFPFIDAPEKKHWQDGLNLLFELGAVDQKHRLTERGRQVASFPIDPKLAVMLVAGLEKSDAKTEVKKTVKEESPPNRNQRPAKRARNAGKQHSGAVAPTQWKHPALNEMLIIASLYSVRDPRERPHHARDKADQCHEKWNDKQSDFMSYLKLWFDLHKQQEALSNREFKLFCHDNFINFVAWLEWRNTYRQLKQLMLEQGASIESKNASAEQVHQCLLPALLSNLMTKTTEAHYQGARNTKIYIHPSSVNFKAKSNWLMAAELVETERLYARTTAPIQPEWIESAAKHLTKSTYLDPHWRKNRGEACAYLQMSLFGLIFVSQRLVSYVSIDGKLSRQWLIEKGLIDGDIQLGASFHVTNQKLLNNFREEETRQRRADILKPDDELFDWFDQRLPEFILGRKPLERWLKGDRKTRNQQLALTELDIVQPQAELDETAFPKELSIRGSQLHLDYRFEPGHDDDGVSICIPLPMMNQFRPNDFDWLVPGLIKEKILCAIKALPKKIRKNFIPAPEYAEACFERLGDSFGEGDFYQRLSEKLTEISGIRLDLDLWKDIQLPIHLTANFKVIAAAKKPIMKGRNLAKLQQALASQIKQSLQQVAFDDINLSESQLKTSDANTRQVNSRNAENSDAKVNDQHLTGAGPLGKLTQWTNDFQFNIEVEALQKRNSTRLLHALKDKATYVSPIGCESLYQAQSTHLSGVCRLLVLSEDKKVKYFLRSWQHRKELQKLTTLVESYPKLIDDVAMALAKQFIGEQQVETFAAYEKTRKDFSDSFTESMNLQLLDLLDILKSAQRISRKVYERVEPRYMKSYQDIRKQLDFLLTENFVFDYGLEQIGQYSRYFVALDKRIERMAINFPREEQCLNEILRIEQFVSGLKESVHHREYCEAKAGLLWMLQEFRVSLFAQGVKTAYPISEKRIEKQIDKMKRFN